MGRIREDEIEGTVLVDALGCEVVRFENGLPYRISTHSVVFPTPVTLPQASRGMEKGAALPICLGPDLKRQWG